MRLVALAIFTTLPCAADLYESKWFIKADMPQVDARELPKIVKDICEGTADGTSCTACPESTSGNWSAVSAVGGHFRTPTSHDAFLQISGCGMLVAGIEPALFITREKGKWRRLDMVIGLETGRCHHMRFQNGRDLMVCESEHGTTDYYDHSIFAISAKADSAVQEMLFVASDDRCGCHKGKHHLALLDSVEIPPAGDAVLITASQGTFEYGDNRVKQCATAWENHIQTDPKNRSHPEIRLPIPKNVNKYTIRILFDGKRFHTAPESRSAAKLFSRKE